MKKLIFSCVCGMLIISANAQLPIATMKRVEQLKVFSAEGNRCFDKNFNEASVGRNDKNAYLLCYLTTLIYPQYLTVRANRTDKAYEDNLHQNKNNFFTQEYRRFTVGLFSNPSYEFVTKSESGGYDPEAMIVSTPTTVFVIFRGTDRVASNKKGSFGYDWNEWLKTDFDPLQTTDENMEGKFHRGFWNSISYKGFKDELFNKIVAAGGKTKKIWITAHSLGSGQAQLFAMYTAKKGMPAHGVYLFAAPHPGNADFAKDLDRIYPDGRLQRFDFVDDPITALPLYSMGYQRAGVRVYYNDINTMKYNAAERSEVDNTNILAGAGISLAKNVANSIVKIDFMNVQSGTPFCYHHPAWYLYAAFKQLSFEQKAVMPVPLPIPDKNQESCDMLIVARGRSGNPINQAVVVVDLVKAEVEKGLEVLKYTAQSIIDNATGKAIDEGEYYISSYASGGKLYLNDEDGAENGSDMRLLPTKKKIKIERFGATGYTLRFERKVVDGWFGTKDEKEFVLDSDAMDLLDNGSTTIQLWEKNNFPLASLNQRWIFNKVKDNKYVILCPANLKVLDADNGKINTNSCGVKTFSPIADDQTQIWILEKAN